VPKFIHELSDAKALFETLGAEKNVLPLVIEKDYWVMHCLWGLQQKGFEFEMKGGTSLSKGWRCIDRFSEDIDIRFEPSEGLTSQEKSEPTSKLDSSFTTLSPKRSRFQGLLWNGTGPSTMRKVATEGLASGSIHTSIPYLS